MNEIGKNIEITMKALDQSIAPYKQISKFGTYVWLNPTKTQDNFESVGYIAKLFKKEPQQNEVVSTYKKISEVLTSKLDELKSQLENTQEILPTSLERISKEIFLIDETINDQKVIAFDSECQEYSQRKGLDFQGVSGVSKALTTVKKIMSQLNPPKKEEGEEYFKNLSEIPVENTSINTKGLFNKDFISGPGIFDRARALTNTISTYFAPDLKSPAKVSQYMQLQALKILKRPNAMLTSGVVRPYLDCLQNNLPEKFGTIHHFHESNYGYVNRYSKEELKDILLDESQKLKKPIFIPLVIPRQDKFHEDHIVTICINDGLIEYFDPKGVNASAQAVGGEIGTVAGMLELCREVFYEEDEFIKFSENTEVIQRDVNNCGVYVCQFIHNRMSEDCSFEDIINSYKNKLTASPMQFRESMIQYIYDTQRKENPIIPNEYANRPDFVTSLAKYYNCEIADLNFEKQKSVPLKSISEQFQEYSISDEQLLLKQIKKDSERSQPLTLVQVEAFEKENVSDDDEDGFEEISEAPIERVSLHSYNQGAEKLDELLPEEIKTFLNGDSEMLHNLIKISIQSYRSTALVHLQSKYNEENFQVVGANAMVRAGDAFIGEAHTLSKNSDGEVILEIARRYNLKNTDSGEASMALDAIESYNLSNLEERGTLKYREVFLDKEWKGGVIGNLDMDDFEIVVE